ncbi:MAG: alpha/beta hydrolase [Gammaproteobacteria bacterium]|nr:alpha/beta hydrolase [Gammaproteobacteria bacterium]MBI5615165.1 alpha/beta hydrolase [Gammaproteobacteria bacterium]
MAKHQLLNVGGTRLHVVEEGEGPLVVMVHGFPELWYSWRFQLPALAAAGYRAVAFDQRGYGRSSKFWQTDSYRISRLVNDVVGLVHALGEKEAVVIGHDWGAPVAWCSAWRHPEIFRGVIGMSVPFSGRGIIALPGNPFGEIPPHEIHRAVAGPDQLFYQEYFSTLGPIIEEAEVDLRGWVRDIVWTVSGEALAGAGISFAGQDQVALIRGSALCVPHGARMRDRFMTPERMPAWFTEKDLDVFVEALEGGGLAGPLSFYYNLENDWHELADLAGTPLTPPAMFIGAEYDVATWWGEEAIARAGEVMPNWRGSHILKGSGHWLQQERAEETNALVIEFLKGL